jgi:hypothetical protein
MPIVRRKRGRKRGWKETGGRGWDSSLRSASPDGVLLYDFSTGTMPAPRCGGKLNCEMVRSHCVRNNVRMPVKESVDDHSRDSLAYLSLPPYLPAPHTYGVGSRSTSAHASFSPLAVGANAIVLRPDRTDEEQRVLTGTLGVFTDRSEECRRCVSAFENPPPS